MKNRVIISNYEELNNLAENVITRLRFTRYQYDENGNDIISDLTMDEVKERIVQQVENAKYDYLNFAQNEELRTFSLQDAFGLTLQTIRDKYLKNVLPIARSIMRKDPRLEHGAVVSDDISDDILDFWLALRWKENLKLWLVQLNMESVIQEKTQKRGEEND